MTTTTVVIGGDKVAANCKDDGCEQYSRVKIFIKGVKI